VSPSKKANNQGTPTKSKNAQKKAQMPSVRSSHVPAQESAQGSNYVQPAITVATEKKHGRTSNVFTNVLRVFALVAVIGITLYIFSIRDRVQDFAALGYPGIFLIALLANATVLLPAPGVAVIYAMGAIFNPLGVALAAGTGGALGELSGYLAGFSGQAVIEQTDVYERVKPWVDKYGGWAILVLSAIPNPFFDIAGIAAGIAKMRLRTFLFFVWIGQLIKMGAFAFAGKYSVHLFSNFFK
jgi:membrane protein YqaA with SNARE-associated domain